MTSLGWSPTIGLAEGIRATYEHWIAVEAASAAHLSAFQVRPMMTAIG
jgi:hypothetical protein